MSHTILITIAITGFTVAFFHAAIPTHWLPFVLAGRAQRWSRGKTLWITALAGSGHVLFTTLLGVLVVWLGIGLNHWVGDAFPLIAGGALLLFGLFYLGRQFRGGEHGHSHIFGGHHPHHRAHDHEHGAHGGILVNLGHGFVELSVFETNVPPRFRLHFYDADVYPGCVPRESVITIETVRPDGERQLFHFNPEQDFLESTSEIPEPHEFNAVITVAHGHHAHHHEVQFVEHDHCHEHSAPPVQPEKAAVASGRQPNSISDWGAIGSLFVLLTFSPCEGFLPVYLSGIKYGWTGFFLLSAIMAGATLTGMVLFTWLTLLGLEKLKLKVLEKYEMGILGGLLCVLSLLVILFEH